MRETTSRRFYAFDTEGGQQRWAEPLVLQGSMLGSPTAARDDGSVYVATDQLLYKISPDGEIAWSRDFQEWAPQSDGSTVFPPTAIPAGLAVTSPNRIILPIVQGYSLSPEPTGMAVWPVGALLAILDRQGNPVAGAL